MEFFAAYSTVCIAFDQWTKWLAVEHLKDGASYRYFYDIILLTYAENRGAWGSLGADWPPTVRFWALTVLPVIILIFFAFSILRRSDTDKLMVTGAGLVIGGGLGNLIDRIYQGYVVDFLYMGIGSIGTNIFNVADMVILAGAGLLIIQHYQESKRHKLNQTATK